MGAYIVRRLLLMVPTLVGIMVINFAIVQIAPGGPVEQTIAQIKGRGGIGGRLGGTGGDVAGPTGPGGVGGGGTSSQSRYRGAQGLRPELIQEIERRYGFDRPPLERFTTMMKRYLVFDFGRASSPAAPWWR